MGAAASGLEVELVNRPEVSKLGLVAVTLPTGTSTSGTGVYFALPPEVVEQITTEVKVTLANGAPLPNWLSFSPATGGFTASAVPDGAFPLQVNLSLGGQQVVVVISEKQP